MAAMIEMLRAIASGMILAAALAPAAARAEVQPIKGHENWTLGMSRAEALAAEPRAAPHDCAGASCLHYADRRFAGAEIEVSARFNAADRLDVIIVTLDVAPGDNRCLRLATQLAAYYTAAHGETLPISGETWIWTSPQASLTLLRQCRIGQEGRISILFEAAAPPGKSD